MTDNPEQRLGYLFGLVGGVLLALGGLVSLVVGVSDMVLGRSIAAVNAEGSAVALFVVGGLTVFFAWLGRHTWSSRPLTAGVLLVALALVGWLVMGVGGSVLALIGGLFAFLAGILYLLDPAKRAVGLAVAAS